MSCKHCDLHLPRFESEADPGLMLHKSDYGELLACENQPPRAATDFLSDEERERLYRTCDIAALIRLNHAVPMFEALDMVRRQSTIDPELLEANERAAVKRILEQENHRCTDNCTTERE